MTKHRLSPKTLPTRRAFTLVELLVVIGIIALLISILLPVLAKAREQAKSIVCQAGEKQILLAWTMYISAHKSATPIFPPVEGTWPTSNDPFHKSWGYYMDQASAGIGGVIRYDKGAFWPYMSSNLHYIQSTGNNQPPPPDVLFRVFNCPTDMEARGTERGGQLNVSVERNFTYSWNAQFYCDSDPPIGDGKSHAIKWSGGHTDLKPVSRVSQIVEPAHKIVLEEEMHPNDGWSFVGFPGGNSDDLPSWRHVGGRGNYGFADGHVESLAPSDIGYSTPFHFNDIPTPINTTTNAFYFHLQSNAF